MATQAITLGPFNKGITDSNLADVNSPNTALDIVNFDPMIDGSLVSRRPQLSLPTYWDGQFQQNAPIGYFQDPTLGLYIIYNTPIGIFYWNKNDNYGGVYWLAQTITLTSRANVAVQYRDKLWIVAYEGASGYWSPSTGFVAVSDMPLGNSAVIKADRLFVTGITSESKLEWSDTGDFTKWYGTGGGYVAVKQNDGHYLQKVVNYNDQLVVFKNKGCWVLNYSTDPGQGSLRLISPIIGTDNCFSAVSRDDYVVTYSSGKIYRVNANSMELLSPTYDNTLNNYSDNNITSSTNYTSMFELSSFVSFIDSDKVIVFVEGKYLVWNILNECWTRYEFTAGKEIGLILEAPAFDDRSANTYFCGGLRFDNTDSYELVGPKTINGSFPNELLPFYASVITKPIDFNAPTNFKRLFHWGVDCIFNGYITGEINPVTVSSTLWSTLASSTWAVLGNGTWRVPLGTGAVYTSGYSLKNQREYFKFPGPSRFRRINFKVEFYRDSDSCTLYTMTAFVKAKELVFARES